MQQSRPSVCLSVCHLNCAATGMHAMVAAAAEWMQWLPSSRHPKGVAGVSFPGKNFIPMKFMFAAGAYCGLLCINVPHLDFVCLILQFY